LFDPWVSKDGACWSDGPVASVRVQAAEERVATARDAITSHFVVVRGIGGFLSEELES
jgi:hypothetical protein